jgi:hypothetical protein
VITLDLLDFSSTLDSVSLAEIDSQWLGTQRYDFKYISNWNSVSDIFEKLSSNLRILEIADRRQFSYHTEYFDTPELILYRDHVQRRRARMKIRHRSYLETDVARFEIKAKHGRSRTQKYMFDTKQRLNDDSKHFVESRVNDLYPGEHFRSIHSELELIAVNDFTRMTLLRLDTNERVTIDSNLLISGRGRESKIAPGRIVIEVKSMTPASGTHTNFRERKIRQSDFSKYAVTVDALISDRPRAHSRRTVERLFPGSTFRSSAELISLR